MQRLLDQTAKECGQSVVDHLRFRLRSILDFAVSEGVADRNPAIAALHARNCQPGRERKVLDSDQLAFVPEVLGLREHVIFRLATWEGMRPGEIIGLQLADFEGDRVWVETPLPGQIR